MGIFKSLTLLALLLSLCLVVIADTSNDAKNEVKPSEATDTVEPQQGGRGGCRYGCCGSYAFGRCSACCSRPQTKAEDISNDVTNGKNEVKPSEATDIVEPQQRGGCRFGCCGAFAFGQCAACCSRPQATEVEAKADTVEPQQRGGCRYGCCGSFAFGRCSACCSRPQTTEVEAKVDTVEPQQGGRGGCRYGCCGSYAFGRCSACCTRPQTTEAEAKTEDNDVKVEGSDNTVVEPQQRFGGGCRFGCCGGWFYGRCNYCCRSPQEKAVEAETVEPQQRIGGGCRFGCCGPWRFGRCSYCCRSPQAEVEVVEPQQRGGCRYGCCGSYANGQCSACCAKKVATEEEKKSEEVKP